VEATVDGPEEAPSSATNTVRLTLEGWSEDTPAGELRLWRDPQGGVLTLKVVIEAILGLPPVSDEIALQCFARSVAESGAAGLIEVHAAEGPLGVTVGLIYKRLQKPAYVFTGILLVPRGDVSQVWTAVAGERGTTGVREAIVTAELVNAGKMTMEGYERSWAQDPYDPGYSGVDRSVLRFVSDDERYDPKFPQHPLSRVRHLLAALPGAVQV
jgi:hypothetical protein